MPLRLALIGLLGLAACGVPAPADPDRAARRGAVELAVKGAWPAILQEVAAGGGPSLTAAFEAAGVPPVERAARALQLQGDSGTAGAAPGALVAALLLYGA